MITHSIAQESRTNGAYALNWGVPLIFELEMAIIGQKIPCYRIDRVLFFSAAPFTAFFSSVATLWPE
jgi:hypothetical protein